MRRVLLNLSHQFTSYTSCGSADQHHLALDDLPHVLGVDINLRTFQEVLNADGLHATDSLRVNLLEVVPLREIRGSEDADVMVDEYLQIFCGVNLPHFERRDDHMIDAVRVHPFKQTVVQRSYAQTRQVVSVALFRSRNKSQRMIRDVTGRTKHLGNRYSGSLRTVNHHTGTRLIAF